MSENNFPRLHNAMWPGLVGKGDLDGKEIRDLVDAATPETAGDTLCEIRIKADNTPVSLESMLDLTAAAEVDGQKFEGIDYFLFLPHTNPEASDDELKEIADLIARTLQGRDDDSVVAAVRADVNALCARFPVYGG